MILSGKTALVTGGAKRVGREIALGLARKGVHILLHYHTSQDEAEQTADEIRRTKSHCDLFSADLAKPSEIDSLLKSILDRTPKLDILVNSASLFYKTPIGDLSESDWDALLNVNLKAPFLLSKKLGLKMRENGEGKIINIADWSAWRPYRDYLAYCVSKGGLITLTKALARELAPSVQCNAIAPGPVLPPPDFTEEEKKAITKKTLLDRMGSPADVANAVLFLVENDFINGTVLTVDGGRSIT